jgi:hypothetical protein
MTQRGWVRILNVLCWAHLPVGRALLGGARVPLQRGSYAPQAADAVQHAHVRVDAAQLVDEPERLLAQVGVALLRMKQMRGEGGDGG